MRFSVTLAAAILLSHWSYSQDSTKFKKFYIEVGGGYAFPFVNDELQSPRSEVGTLNYLLRPDSTYSVKPVKGTLGQGWKGSFGIGYMFHKNIGFEFQFNYVKGDGILMSQIESPNYSASHTLTSHRVEAIPQLVLNHQMKKWSIYSKSGVILPLWGYVQSTISVDDNEGRVIESLLGFAIPNTEATVRATARTNPRFSYGFQTRVGVAFNATNWLDIYVEASYAALSVRAKETITEEFDVSVYNTVSETTFTMEKDEISTISLNSNYVEELTENSNNPEFNPNADPDKALDEPAFKDNFNHVGVNVGLRFRLF